MPMNSAKVEWAKNVSTRERTRTVFSSGGNTLFLYWGLGRSGSDFWGKNRCADRDNVVLIPLRIAVLQEHEHREEDIEPEFEDLKVGSSHCSCGSRGAHSPLSSALTSPMDKIPLNTAAWLRIPRSAFHPHHGSL
jgi:hypothetical protein